MSCQCPLLAPVDRIRPPLRVVTGVRAWTPETRCARQAISALPKGQMDPAASSCREISSDVPVRQIADRGSSPVEAATNKQGFAERSRPSLELL